MNGTDDNARAYFSALAEVLADVPYAPIARSRELVRLVQGSLDRVLASADPLILHAEAVALRAVATVRR